MTDRLVHFEQKQYPSSFHDIPHIKTISVTNAKLKTQKNDPSMIPHSYSNLPLNTEDTKEDLIIPITEQRKQYRREESIKEGLILCTRVEEWYTKRKTTTTRELQLRKRRLRWRQFKAVLLPNRLELYHATVRHEPNLFFLNSLLIWYTL
jgi:hypothetical protein